MHHQKKQSFENLWEQRARAMRQALETAEKRCIESGSNEALIDFFRSEHRRHFLYYIGDRGSVYFVGVHTHKDFKGVTTSYTGKINDLHGAYELMRHLLLTHFSYTAEDATDVDKFTKLVKAIFGTPGYLEMDCRNYSSCQGAVVLRSPMSPEDFAVLSHCNEDKALTSSARLADGSEEARAKALQSGMGFLCSLQTLAADRHSDTGPSELLVLASKTGDLDLIGGKMSFGEFLLNHATPNVGSLRCFFREALEEVFSLHEEDITALLGEAGQCSTAAACFRAGLPGRDELRLHAKESFATVLLRKEVGGRCVWLALQFFCVTTRLCAVHVHQLQRPPGVADTLAGMLAHLGGLPAPDTITLPQPLPQRTRTHAMFGAGNVQPSPFSQGLFPKAHVVGIARDDSTMLYKCGAVGGSAYYVNALLANDRFESCQILTRQRGLLAGEQVYPSPEAALDALEAQALDFLDMERLPEEVDGSGLASVFRGLSVGGTAAGTTAIVPGDFEPLPPARGRIPNPEERVVRVLRTRCRGPEAYEWKLRIIRVFETATPDGVRHQCLGVDAFCTNVDARLSSRGKPSPNKHNAAGGAGGGSAGGGKWGRSSNSGGGRGSNSSGSGGGRGSNSSSSGGGRWGSNSSSSGGGRGSNSSSSGGGRGSNGSSSGGGRWGSNSSSSGGGRWGSNSSSSGGGSGRVNGH
jgi:hypothetical protein